MGQSKESGQLSPHEGEITFDTICKRFPQVSTAAANTWRFDGTSRAQRVIMGLNRGWWQVTRDFCLGAADDELLFRLLTKSDGVLPSLIGGSLRIRTIVCYAGKRSEENVRGFVFCFGYKEALFVNRELTVRGTTRIPNNVRYPRIGREVSMYEEVGRKLTGSMRCTRITGNWP